VTERSGKKSWVHWRLQCPKLLRHTLVEGAAESTRHAFWAQVYYQQQRDKGTASEPGKADLLHFPSVASPQLLL
jgi:hypothetical protein